MDTIYPIFPRFVLDLDSDRYGGILSLMMCRLIFTILILTIACHHIPLLKAPELARVIMDEKSVMIYWYPSVDEASEDFYGYNVYIFTDTTVYDLSGDNDTFFDYLRNQNPIRDTFYYIPDLSKDIIYYLQVRTVSGKNTVGDYPDWRYVSVSPRPEFTVFLEMAIGPDSRCAVHFSTGEIGLRDDLSESWGDLWVDYNSVTDSIWFNSPSYGNQNCRITFLENKGKMDLDDLSEITQDPNKVSVCVESGDLIVARTEDKNYLKIHVDEVDKINYTVKITYAYQNISEFPHFGPR